MPAQSNSGKATRSALILLFIGAMVFVAAAAGVQYLTQHRVLTVIDRVSPESEDAPAERPTRVPAPRHESAPSESTTKAVFSVPEVHGNDVSLVSASEQPAEGEEPAVFLANQSLKAVHADGAKALSVKVSDGLAKIDFSPEIESGLGSFQEANFIQALKVSLGQIPEIDRFQITVGGQAVDSLGHFEITDPVDVIRPTVKP